jgi:hypothetical protein
MHPPGTVAPKYVIKSTRVGEHTQFMKDHALIGKFLGLWPSEKDLTRWIKTWWNPKGDYELQLSSKGFFTVIFYNLEDKDRIFENDPYFYNSVGCTYASGQIASAQKRRTSPSLQSGSTSTHYPRSSGWKKS